MNYKTYIVYCHTNLFNQKKYIGITSQSPQDRWRNEGKGYQGQPKFYNAILKYGWSNFSHEILYTGLSEDAAIAQEKFLIQQYDTIKNGYNTSIGGNITNHTQITKDKIATALVGKNHTKETIEHIKNTKIAKYGKAIRCIENNIVYPSLGEASRQTGIDKSSLTRCCEGKQLTAGLLHWAWATNKSAPLVKDKRKRAVLCVTTGIQYDSIQAAALDTNSDPSNISKVCNGKYKTTNHLKWKWIEND